VEAIHRCQKTVPERLAHGAKGHYTFARCSRRARLGWPAAMP